LRLEPFLESVFKSNIGAENKKWQLGTQHQYNDRITRRIPVASLRFARVEITLYSNEPIETEVAIGHIPGLIFGKKFSTHWVEYWQGGKMIGETTLRPLDWFILRHLHFNMSGDTTI